MPFSGLWTMPALHSSPLTINHSQVPSDQTDFPVLVNFTDNRFKTFVNGGHVANANGFDLGFYSDAGGTTKLKWEVERYNGTTGEIVAWVKIGTVSSVSDTTFYAFYGNSSIHTDQSDPVNVWTNSFSGVYHLKDGTTLSLADSTGTSNGSTTSSPTAATGQIDGGGGFASASSQFINLATTSFQPSALTLSCWVNGTTFPNDYNGVITKGAASVDTCVMFVKSNGKLYCSVSCASGTPNFDGTGSHTLSVSTWYYLVLTYNNTAGLVAYVNAASDNTVAQAGLATTGSAQTGCGRQASTGTRYWNGVLDEPRLITTARSADWVTCEYNNQKSSQTFLTLGTEV